MAPNTLLLNLMYQQGCEYINASTYLAEANNSTQFSAASTILKILGFEILLKTAICINKNKLIHGHEYSSMIREFDDKTLSLIISSACTYCNPYNQKNIKTYLEYILEQTKDYFLKGRYSYEAYKNMTKKEYIDHGNAWQDNGAKCEDADFQVFSEEIYALTMGLKHYIKAHIDKENPPA